MEGQSIEIVITMLVNPEILQIANKNLVHGMVISGHLSHPQEPCPDVSGPGAQSDAKGARMDGGWTEAVFHRQNRSIQLVVVLRTWSHKPSRSEDVGLGRSLLVGVAICS